MNIINPFSVTISFGLILAGLAYFKPGIGKIVTGIFFLIMAFGVNVPILFTDPTLFSAAGEKALLPVYHWFFTEILKNYPIPFVVALILFEATTGVLILSKGKAVKLGLLAASLFCLFITPVGMEEITAPALVISFAILWKKTTDEGNRKVPAQEWVANT